MPDTAAAVLTVSATCTAALAVLLLVVAALSATCAATVPAGLRAAAVVVAALSVGVVAGVGCLVVRGGRGPPGRPAGPTPPPPAAARAGVGSGFGSKVVAV